MLSMIPTATTALDASPADKLSFSIDGQTPDLASGYHEIDSDGLITLCDLTARSRYCLRREAAPI